MNSLGARLREARQRQGLELSTIAEELKIGSRYLEAMETGDVDQLPGGFFARSFFQQYAAYLGIPPDEVNRELRSLLSSDSTPYLPGEEPAKQGSDLPPLPRFRSGNGQSRRALSAVAALVAVVSVCGMAYRMWQAEPAEEPISLVAEAPQQPVAQTQQQQPTAAASQQELARAHPEGPLWLELEASEEVWVQITASGGRVVFSGLLQPSETKQLTGLEEASVRVGNAGGLHMYWNGKPVGKIGASGQIRVVRVTPEEGPEILTNSRSGSEDQPDAAAAPANQT